MKINTTLAIALLIAGSSLYAEEFRGHSQKKEDTCRKCDKKRHEHREHKHHKMSY